MSEAEFDLPVGPIPDLLAWWKQAGVQGIVIGGLAVAIHTRARTTKDVDAVVILGEKDWGNFFELGQQFSFVSRVSDPLAFARKSRIFILKHVPSGVDVDLSLGCLPFEHEALRRVKHVEYCGSTIPVATVEDLVVMKVLANRDQDLADVRRVLLDYKDIDLAYIRSHLDKFAAMLDASDLLADFENLVLNRNRTRRPRSQ